ncbi:SusC/RagA family TonB-linked outer membrane protein [Ginsengibacter hankyongi]|uniref:SusC/RagA family TonB-linked outer membrane protein n=1 Tax=Ginsengibacter hankyongi TaxID=2607284 RepID=A0A5J5IAP5_9BACT|nr:SusC/RagA family TonB-linked outer membrane protein [Ginsengibacter hankyongi]KAA9034452.1 SusC/RagA family TonB-linked outer membrane protein [Ginsengibacter hankyongi]
MRKSALCFLLTRLSFLTLLLLFLLSNSLFSQNTIRGKVTGSEGKPLVGATVTIGRGGKSTLTDTLGRFSIIAGPGNVMIISYVGYREQRIIPGNETELNISLSVAPHNLDEVVMIGYGTSKKKDITGAVGSVSEKDFNKGNFSSPDQLIQGKVSGVQMISNNGVPGGAMTIKIRGNSALVGTGQPLFVVDGVPLDSRSLQPGNDPLNFLNPADIASIDILKDASATAIYGSRAAYGVVIINTKKAQTGVTKLDVAVSAGVSSILKKIKVLNASQYRDAIKYYGIDPSYDKGGNADGMNAVLHDSWQQNYFIAGSGGTENSKYRFSAGYLNQDGIIINTGFKRYNAGITSNLKFLENKKLGLDINLNSSQYLQHGSADLSYGNAGIMQTALQWNPTDSLRNADGSIKMAGGDNVNPVALSKFARQTLKVTTVLGSLSPYYKFSDWLEYKILFSISYSSGISRSYMDQALGIYPFYPPGGNAGINNYELLTEQFTHTLTYNKAIARNLHLNAIVGYEYMKFTNQGYSLSGNGAQGVGFGNFGLNYTNYLQYSDPGSRSIASYIDPLSELQSFFGRTIFNYKDRYLLTATFRADGSTKFGSNNKYGYFPSFALAWNISQEKFFKVDIINSLKIRGGWGKTGNQEFPPGSAQALYALQNGGSVVQLNNPNPDLKWQSDQQYNIGIDFSILNNRVSGTADYFNKNTTSLLFPSAPIQPAPPGSIVRWINLDGQIHNKGFEVLVNGDIVKNKEFEWNLSVNATFLKNNVSGMPAPIATAFLSGPVETIRNGLPMEAFYTRKFLGLDKSTGFSTYQDSGTTLHYVGDPNPKMLLGISTSFRYGKFLLTANMYGSYGQDIFNNTLMALLNVDGIQGGNIALSVYQNPVKESLANPVTPSSRPIQKGNYLKMSNLTISYNIGDVAKAFKGVNMYITAQNLFIITRYSGFDPEVNVDADTNPAGVPGLGVDFARYPSSTSFIVGINFSL